MEKEYKEFCKKLKKKLEKRFSDEGCRIELHSIMKNNSVRYDGLVIHSAENSISPNFYVRALYAHYQNGISLDDLVSRIAVQYYEAQYKKEAMDLDVSYENCQNRIIFRLISYEKNKALLEKMPYVSYLDMAVVFYVMVHHDKDGVGSFPVSNALMEVWKVDEEVLMAKASENTRKIFPLKLYNMYHMLGEMIREKAPDKEIESYFSEEIMGEMDDAPIVLTNQSGIHGAAVLLYEETLKAVSDLFQGDFYVLPSSIHEILAVPYSASVSQKEIKEMVIEVNQDCVSADEILSDHVYFYDSQREILEICI